MARPRRHLPPGARDFIMSVAESGALQETKVARGLGLSLDNLRRIVREDEHAAALWREAMAVERDAIIQRQYERAMEGDSRAATFLLAARHGLREQDGGDAGQKGGNITIQLPGSMTEAQWRRMLQVEQSAPALEGGDG